MSKIASVSDQVTVKDSRALQQMADTLCKQGLRVKLIQNAVPRMYYSNQIERQLLAAGKKMQYHRNPEECDFILQVQDAYYDIGFLKDLHGNYIPLFDDHYGPSNLVSSTKAGKGPIADFLGVKAEGEDHTPEEAIGKALYAYAYHAAVNTAEAQGYDTSECRILENGDTFLEFSKEDTYVEELYV